MNEPNLLDDPLALRRHLLISLFRFAMVGVVMGGIALTYGRISALSVFPQWVGIPLALGGMVGFFYGPKFLASGWTSPADDESSDR